MRLWVHLLLTIAPVSTFVAIVVFFKFQFAVVRQPSVAFVVAVVRGSSRLSSSSSNRFRGTDETPTLPKEGPTSRHYPTQYVPPQRGKGSGKKNDGGGKSRNFTLTVTTLRGRAVYVLDESPSSSLDTTSNPSLPLSVKVAHSATLGRGDSDGDNNATTTNRPSSASLSWSSSWSLERPSVLAERHGCTYAVNAGPFHSDGSPVGSLVSNGRVLAPDTHGNDDLVGLGVTKLQVAVNPSSSSQPSWVLGSLSKPAELSAMQDFVTGFGWLVYKGRNVVAEPDDEKRTGAVRAPRTAVGVTDSGRLVVVVADGCEKWYVTRTPTDYTVRAAI
jgi:hypothetical protein